MEKTSYSSMLVKSPAGSAPLIKDGFLAVNFLMTYSQRCCNNQRCFPYREKKTSQVHFSNNTEISTIFLVILCNLRKMIVIKMVVGHPLF